MRYFENESEVEYIDGLTFENRVDRISLSGGLDITKDRPGLQRVNQMIAKLQSIAEVLEKEGDALPDAIEIIAPTVVANPFNSPDV